MVAQLSWPDSPPAGMKPFRWMLDGGGRDVVASIVNRNGLRSMLEIGVFLGGGSIQLLDACPCLRIYGLDPYEEPYPDYSSIGHYYLANRRIYQSAVDASGITEEEFLAQMSRPLVQLDAVIANLWAYRERFTAVKGFSPTALPPLAAEGFEPDIVFLDADKSGVELPVISRLWPRCIIAGDDWTWHNQSGENPLHRMVRRTAEGRNMSLIVKDAVWVLEPHDRHLV